MKTRTIVYCTTQFQAWHNWPGAPDEVAFLRSMHRHMFHVKVWKAVNHDDRDIEFISFKRDVDQYIGNTFEDEQLEGVSCEMMARAILEKFDAACVLVSEDDENGALVEDVEHSVNTMSLPSPLAKTLQASIDLVQGEKQRQENYEKDMEHRRLEEKYGNCFIGIEAEGPRRGMKTLFVPGSTSIEQYRAVMDFLIEKSYYGEQHLEHIYLGAGDEPLREATTLFIYLLGKMFPNSGNYIKYLTIECSDTEFLSKHPIPKGTITVGPFGSRVEPNYSKIIDATRNRIVWQSTTTGQQFSTLISDALFRADVKIKALGDTPIPDFENLPKE